MNELILSSNSATQVVALFETNKETRIQVVESLINAIDSGEINPLNMHLQIKAMDEIIKTVTNSDVYKNHLLDECEKFESKSFSFKNAQIQIKEVGVKYDFSVCNDPVLISLQKAFDDASLSLKERQDFLKKIPYKGIEVLDNENGEMVTIYPPNKSSTTAPTFTLR